MVVGTLIAPKSAVSECTVEHALTCHCHHASTRRDVLVAHSAANVCPTWPLLHGTLLQRLLAYAQHVPTFRSWNNVFPYSFSVIAGSTVTSSINTRAVNTSRSPCQPPRRRPTLPTLPRLHVVPTKQEYKILGMGVRLRYREGFRAAMGLQIVHPKERAEARQRHCLWDSKC